jgi:hypothetical protein
VWALEIRPGKVQTIAARFESLSIVESARNIARLHPHPVKMDMPMMSMVFTSSQTTPLYSQSWTPSSTGEYAGICIFLIVLSVIGRLLVAFKVVMEQKWLAIALNRRYVVVTGQKPEAEIADADPDSIKATLLTKQGVEENVKVVRRVSRGPQPWRFSVDLPRALLFLCISGVAYLLYVYCTPFLSSAGS